MAQSSATRRRAQKRNRHSRKHLHQPASLGARAADLLTGFQGSWKFVGLSTLWFLLWFLLRADVGLLTNIVSLEAIYMASFVMMSQNRSASIDRARDDHEAKEVDELHGINQTQLEILLLLKALQAPSSPKEK